MGMVDGKIAIITGATSGIGARAAQLFVEEGATVYFTGRRREEGEALAGAIGAGATFLRADATSEAEQRVHGGIFRLQDGKANTSSLKGTGLGYQMDRIKALGQEEG